MEWSLILRSLAWLIASSLSSPAGDQPLRLIHTIPLPGVKGRFDHFACDPKAERLIVAALGNNTCEVFGASDFKRTGTITGLHKPTGTLALSESKRFFVANGDDG